MNISEKIIFKNKLKQFCQQMIEQRISAAKKAIDNARESSIAEEKSSAGDKYETARAMGHLESDMYSRQLMENIKELSALNTITTNVIYHSVTAGTFIVCNEISFFIISGLGKQVVDGEPILFLSPHAPLAKSLGNKKAGDHFSFNGTDMVIVEIY
jgi:hypothetical protein